MTPACERNLWTGRILALVGIVLVAVNVRTAVASLSPVVIQISDDIPLSGFLLGVLGMLPPLCFAIFGVATPSLTRRFGLERVLLAALLLLTLGLFGRSFAGSSIVLLAASALAFAAIGVGNVLLPPLVKKYFPDRIGMLTALYATAMSVSTLLPPLVAVPVADAAGWRASFAQWGVVAAVSLVPWVFLLVRSRSGGRDAQVEEGEPAIVNRLWTSPLAWSLAIVFAVSAFNAYVIFTWLPQILLDTTGVTAGQAGALLALYAATGLPSALVVPVLASRYGRVRTLVGIGVGSLTVGYLGLLLVPDQATWLWVACAGVGPLLFPLSLVLINLRTLTHAAAVALSGFVQSVGYSIAAVGPLAVGMLAVWTGGWAWPIIALLVSGIPAAVAGLFVARAPALEEELSRRERRRE